MTGSIQVADFDIQIAEILLVHRNTFVHRFKWTEYRTGRLIDGMTFCVSGRASFDYGDSSFELTPGQAVFLPACSSYVVRCESEEPFIHYTVNFRLDRSEMTAEQTAFSEILSGKLRHITSPEKAETYQPRLEELLSVWQSKRNGYRVMAKALIYELLYLYFTDAGRTHRNKAARRKLYGLPERRRARRAMRHERDPFQADVRKALCRPADRIPAQKAYPARKGSAALRAVHDLRGRAAGRLLRSELFCQNF